MTVFRCNPDVPVLRHTLNHLGVVVASKLMPLASLLVYSRFLEPEEYGVVSLFFSYIWIFGILLTVNMHTAIGRFIYDRGNQIETLVGTTLVCVLLPFITIAFIAIVELDRFAGLLNLPVTSVPFLFMVAAGQIVESLLIQVLTAQERSGQLLAANLMRSVGSMSLTVILLYELPTKKYYAVIYAESLFSGVLGVYLLYIFAQHRPWVFSAKMLRKFASYSIPLIPYMLSLTLISQFDRVMIDRMFGKESTGVYSIGYNLGILVVMVAGGLLNALNPRFFAAMNERRYNDVRRDTSAVFSLCVFGAFSLALIGPDLAALVISARYAEGFALIPVVALGGLASVVFQLWGRVVGYINKTYILSVIALAAVAIKIGLNMLVLPSFGYWGAAITTVIAYGFMAFCVVVMINREKDLIRVNLTPEIGWLGLLTLVVIVLQSIDKVGLLGMFLKVTTLLIVMWATWLSAKKLLRPSE